MEKLKNRIKYWLQLFLLPVYAFSFITIRNKKLWLFGSSFGKRFADNPRYLFLYVSQLKNENIHAVWISKDRKIVQFLRGKGLEAYYRLSLQGIFYCLHGGVYIFDNYSKDISFWLSGGAKKVNLWHGSGNKKINYDNKFDKLRHPSSLRERFSNSLLTISNEKPSHYILATSDLMGHIFASAFHVPFHHVIVDGYPRNDILFDECLIEPIYTEEEEVVLSDLKMRKQLDMYIMIYFPTFRESETKFFEVTDLEKFQKFLHDRNMICYIKLHPKSKLKQEFDKLDYENIRIIRPSVDTYTILGEADMLITDYSSIHTDFLMLNRPSVLYTYDLEEYSKDTRECYFEYDKYMPELRTYTMESLMNGIESVRENDCYEEGRLLLRSKMFEYVDCHASERLCKKIQKILE